jgi:UDPglucose 6-dehydrogenase
MMRVAMIGGGYVGLTTGACLADLGHEVVCVDKDPRRIADLDRGKIPIYEPGLQPLVARLKKLERLSFTSDLPSATRAADVVFIAVGTPSRADGSIDLAQVEAAALEVAPHLADDALVVIKSTVVPGTCRRIADLIAGAVPGRSISVVSNPEFLREGSAIVDFMQPDRIVIGGRNAAGISRLRKLYSPFGKRNVPFVVTTPENAELIKYAANAFLALKIGYINDIANLCEQIGGDVRAVAHGIGLDPRIGSSFLAAGPGFGGSCFPKDTRALAAFGREAGAPQPLIELLIARNEDRMRGIVRRILEKIGQRAAARDATVAVFGLAFKANTDDVREAAGLTVIPMLQQAGIRVRAHDPEAMVTASQLLADVEWCDCPYGAAREADVIVVLTEWPSFRDIDVNRLAGSMRGQSVLDYRHVFNPSSAVSAGLDYWAVGAAPAAVPA